LFTDRAREGASAVLSTSTAIPAPALERRLETCLIYLNRRWKEEYGGASRACGGPTPFAARAGIPSALLGPLVVFSAPRTVPKPTATGAAACPGEGMTPASRSLIY